MKGFSIKGRATAINLGGRFEQYTREPFHDGTEGREHELIEELTHAGCHGLKTEVYSDTIRSLISYNESPDTPFDRSINPYRGCEHGCIYCYARPSHGYLNLSPGLDFETKIFSKANAARILENELRKKSYRPAVIALGANTDPYQPLEKSANNTRRILEVLLKHRHPVGIITKSALVLRDLDILKEMAELNLIAVNLSITSLRSDIALTLEPRASAPHRRLEAIEKLRSEGIAAGVMVAPILPGLTDNEIEAILENASQAGALFAGYVLLRLPYEVKDLFSDWLETNFPKKKDRVLHLVRSTRNGQLNDSNFASRMQGSGQYADLIRKRFLLTVKRLGLNRDMKDFRLDLKHFRHQPEEGLQGTLF